jgi:hypothetical protein
MARKSERSIGSPGSPAEAPSPPAVADSPRPAQDSLPGGPQPGRYAQATADLRSAAKWLLAVLAAVAAALLAGLQLTQLGELHGDWWRLAAALISSLVGLGAVGYMIAATSQVFTDEWVTLADLDDSAFDQKLNTTRNAKRADLYKTLRTQIDRDRQWLYRHVAEDIPQLHGQLRRANDNSRIRSAAPGASDPAAQLEAVRATITEVTDCANYHHTRLILRRLRPRLAWASAVVVGAILIFAYASNPPAEPAGPVQIQIVSPSTR